MERDGLRKLTMLCALCGLVGLALLGTTAVREQQREWKEHQQEYRELLLNKIDRDANPALYARVADMTPEIKQVMVAGLGVVERCTTCHLGIEDTLFSSSRQPLMTHPNLGLLEHHPVETFGCTICHGGQAAATTYEGASHQSMAHWPDPMVKNGFMESRCGYCHKDYEAIGTDKLSLGKKLFKDLHCSGCHKVDPADGSMAPALTAFADKDPGSFDFTHIDGDRSKQNWVMEHFRNPQKVTPGSPMSIYAMNEHQVEALTTYVLSLTERYFTLQYYPRQELALNR